MLLQKTLSFGLCDQINQVQKYLYFIEFVYFIIWISQQLSLGHKVKTLSGCNSILEHGTIDQRRFGIKY